MKEKNKNQFFRLHNYKENLWTDMLSTYWFNISTTETKMRKKGSITERIEGTLVDVTIFYIKNLTKDHENEKI